MDLNGDGVLSKEELVKGYLKYLPENEAIEYVNDIMKQIDKNNNGEIDYMGNYYYYYYYYYYYIKK